MKPEKPLKFDSPDNPPKYFYHRPCDAGQGMRIFPKGIKYRGEEPTETEFSDDGVCPG